MSRSLTALTLVPGPGTTTVSAGQTSQFQAQGTYTESGHATTMRNVTTAVTWQSSNPAVATISSAGLATGLSAGKATITGNMQGSFGPVSATSDITVTASTTPTPIPRVLSSLIVIPASQTVVATGETAQLIAIGTYSSGSPQTQDLTSQVSWRSSDVNVAQVNSAGQVTGVGAGQATITALATAPDGSILNAIATLTEVSTSSANLPTLTVYPVGSGAGSVTGAPLTGPGAGNVVITCNSGSTTGCVGNFPAGTVVLLVATPTVNATPVSQFDGWSSNCIPVTATPYPYSYPANPTPYPHACTITISNNNNVGAIFDPVNPANP